MQSKIYYGRFIEKSWLILAALTDNVNNLTPPAFQFIGSGCGVPLKVL